MTVYFAGRVQGVGFRFTTVNVSRGFAVTGFVQNMPDGRVRLVAEGSREQVRAFLDAVAGELAGHIHSTDETSTVATGEFARFDTRY